MLHNRNKLSSFFRFRSGFTLVELLLAVVALPVVLVGIVFLNAYVPSLILRSLGYEIDFWFYFAVNVVAGVIGYGYTLLGASRTASKDAPASKRLAKASLAYLLHSVLLMLIFAETGNDIGFLHLLLAGLTMPILWQLALLAVRRYRSGRSSGIAEKSTLI